MGLTEAGMPWGGYPVALCSRCLLPRDFCGTDGKSWGEAVCSSRAKDGSSQSRVGGRRSSSVCLFGAAPCILAEQQLIFGCSFWMLPAGAPRGGGRHRAPPVRARVPGTASWTALPACTLAQGHAASCSKRTETDCDALMMCSRLWVVFGILRTRQAQIAPRKKQAQ